MHAIRKLEAEHSMYIDCDGSKIRDGETDFVLAKIEGYEWTKVKDVEYIGGPPPRKLPKEFPMTPFAWKD
jgi:hypothetical protein